MIYGNYNGYAYTEGEMETLITEGRAKADEFYPIDTYYNVLESENGGEFELSFLMFATKEDARRYIKGMQDAHAADVAENLVPYWYTYEYKVEEIKVVKELEV